VDFILYLSFMQIRNIFNAKNFCAISDVANIYKTWELYRIVIVDEGFRDFNFIKSYPVILKLFINRKMAVKFYAFIFRGSNCVQLI